MKSTVEPGFYFVKFATGDDTAAQWEVGKLVIDDAGNRCWFLCEEKDFSHSEDDLLEVGPRVKMPDEIAVYWSIEIMRYNKAVEVENLKENTVEILQSVSGLTPEDAMNALGAAVSFTVVSNWAEPDRMKLIQDWFSMVRSSLVLSSSIPGE
jgi:hypothetical protein